MRMRLLAGSSEAAPLAQLHAECFPDAWSVESFRSLLEQPATFALIADDGFVLIRIAGDESEVLSLGVTPAARRRGIGSSLLSASLNEAEARGAKTMFLEVGCRNSPALALYKRHGFVEVGCRKGYYLAPDGNREDALVLRTEIPPARVGKCMQLG